jgi:hypothetical protein
MVLLLMKKRTLFSKIQAVRAHEVKLVSWASQLSLQALVQTGPTELPLLKYQKSNKMFFLKVNFKITRYFCLTYKLRKKMQRKLNVVSCNFLTCDTHTYILRSIKNCLDVCQNGKKLPTG